MRKCLKNKIFLPCHSHFPRSIQIPKGPICEIAPPETQIDVRCKQPRFENSPCCARSIRRDVGQVLRRQTFPCSSYDALLARGQSPDSAYLKNRGNQNKLFQQKNSRLFFVKKEPKILINNKITVQNIPEYGFPLTGFFPYKDKIRFFLTRMFPYKDRIKDPVLIGKIRISEKNRFLAYFMQ